MNTSEPIILYVDDERSNRVVFEQSFNHRFRISTASNGEEALTKLAADDIGVLVTDQRMPGMDGNSLLARSQELFPDIIRLIVTAYSDLEPILSAVNNGLVARYIIKPWDADELGRALEWSIEAFQLGRRNSAIQIRLLETERLATLGSIVAGVVHDLNGPLSYVTVGAERLNGLAKSPELEALQGLSPRVPTPISMLLDELAEVTNDIFSGAQLMTDILQGLKNMSRKRVAAGKNATAEPVAVIRYAMAVCHQMVLVSEGAIQYDGPERLPKVALSVTELTQVMINFISNAAEAISLGEGGRVLVTAKSDGNAARFIVRDDGAGMSREVLTKIGTPFFTTKEDGTGLGVSQCRRIIESVAGSLEIRSEPGEGTTVSFLLPFYRPINAV